MKLYDFIGAPSPRRVRIFLAEKGLTIPTQPVNLAAGEQFADAFRAVNPACTVPALQLDDGTVIAESSAICRYFEELHPSPPLMGTSAVEKAVIAMWDRRMEADGFQAVAEAFRNAVPGLKGRALIGPHSYAQIPELAERGKARVADFFTDLDARLQSSPYVAGDAFSVADITAIVTLDFATLRAKLPLPDSLAALTRWRDLVSARPSMTA